MNLVLVQIPGVPIMYITKHKYSIERLPEATIGGGKYIFRSFTYKKDTFFFFKKTESACLVDLPYLVF